MRRMSCAFWFLVEVSFFFVLFDSVLCESPFTIDPRESFFGLSSSHSSSRFEEHGRSFDTCLVLLQETREKYLLSCTSLNRPWNASSQPTFKWVLNHCIYPVISLSVSFAFVSITCLFVVRPLLPSWVSRHDQRSLFHVVLILRISSSSWSSSSWEWFLLRIPCFDLTLNRLRVTL